ncbi:MAG: 16S rRNA (adenine(1518)-N(6)/adenine(1519)-N(6))-dimethyltransferase [Flavobacteriales bacterium]|nr:MAG: 16S rRNA (adenine(1518)-N(6)/adenine(1519)-N(6))-dimethyltransferase [Flavobacteriales bacterium]
MRRVRAKKKLGQHFLIDGEIAERIVNSLEEHISNQDVLEIGPGMGVLTSLLLKRKLPGLHVIELDHEAVNYLLGQYPDLEKHLMQGDFLKMNLEALGSGNLAIIGNFPYNISSQILFKVLDNHNKVNLLVGMFQKEVAERLASDPGSRKYGILSVLLQAYYDIEYLFSVSASKFKPPPKVESAVIRITRNKRTTLGCDEKRFRKVVKGGFNHRRKTLRNALKLTITLPANFDNPYLNKRAEQLSVDDFITLTNLLDKS